VGRVDVALEEYRQLRAEILSHAQAQTTVVTIALTATAAIAGVAFGTGATGNPERLEILLALPLILIGLGLTYLAHSVNVVAIGRYIGDGLWPALAAAQPDDASQAGGATVIHSWEKTVASGRGFSKAAKGIKGLLSWVPGVFLFGLPSIAALAINYNSHRCRSSTERRLGWKSHGYWKRSPFSLRRACSAPWEGTAAARRGRALTRSLTTRSHRWRRWKLRPTWVVIMPPALRCCTEPPSRRPDTF
jgi:hypothetical protein